MTIRILRDLANSTAVPREADAEAGAGPVEEAARTKIADRLWVDTNGKEVEQPELATGVLYEFLGRAKDGVAKDGKAFVIQFSDMTDAAKNMLAGFGAHTLMGNVTNTWLSEKGDKTATAYDAIAERFQLLNSGTWIDRTGGGVGAKVDKDALAEAICQVLVASGKWTQDLVDTSKKAEVRQGLEDDATKVKSARQNPAIASKYAELVGRQVKSEDDVAGLFA